MGRTLTRREELKTLEANLRRAQAKVDSGYGGGQAVTYYKEQIAAKKRQIEREDNKKTYDGVFDEMHNS